MPNTARCSPAGRRAVRPIVVAAVAAAAAACGVVSSVTPRGGAAPGTPVAAGGRTSGTGLGRPDSGLFGLGRDRRTTPQGGPEGARRVCRTGARPRGWIAVAYEHAADACPAGVAPRDSGATAAVLVRYDALPRGTRLDVCADQPTPARWREVRDEAPGAPDACPGAERSGQPAVRRIARVE